jgi:hypothetical protein
MQTPGLGLKVAAIVNALLLGIAFIGCRARTDGIFPPFPNISFVPIPNISPVLPNIAPPPPPPHFPNIAPPPVLFPHTVAQLPPQFPTIAPPPPPIFPIIAPPPPR